MLGEMVKRLCKDAGIGLGQFTNNSQRAKALVLKKFEFDKDSSQFEPIS